MIDPEIDRLRRQNRELVTEIKIRDGVISGLQNTLAALETTLAALEAENATLRLYHKDWCEGHSASTRAGFIGPPTVR
jgi:hypothetical protein